MSLNYLYTTWKYLHVSLKYTEVTSLKYLAFWSKLKKKKIQQQQPACDNEFAFSCLCFQMSLSRSIVSPSMSVSFLFLQ